MGHLRRTAPTSLIFDTMNTATLEARTAEILLVEDSPGDVRLTREALRDAEIPSHLHVVEDGEVATAFLNHEPPFEMSPRPDLILLDLNLPKKDGREVLREIKANPALRRIPVVVLSTSQAAEDIAAVYDLSANCFISKPVDFDRFLDVVRVIKEFWLTVAQLPNSDG